MQKYLALQEEHYALKEVCTEQERTLEELGGQLSAAKLAAVELREAADNAQQQHQQQEGAATWANDRLVTRCRACDREFSLTRRKVIKLFNCPHAFHRPPPPPLPSCPFQPAQPGRGDSAESPGVARLIVQLSLPPWKLLVPRSRFLPTGCPNRPEGEARARWTMLTASRGFIVPPVHASPRPTEPPPGEIANRVRQWELWCTTVLLLEITRCIAVKPSNYNRGPAPCPSAPPFPGRMSG